MLKHKIPVLAPLCLSLTSALACGPTPESVAEDFCMKFIECNPDYTDQQVNGQNYQEYCVTYYTQYFEMLETQYSSSCSDAILHFYACLVDVVTCDAPESAETQCETEEREATMACDFDEADPSEGR